MVTCRKIQISINSDLLDRAEQYADDNALSRSGLIAVALRQFLDAQDITTAIKRMSVAMQVIAEKGEVDADTLRELNNFKILSEMLYSK